MGAAFRLARRELRGGVRSQVVLLLCLVLGVAAIAAVGTIGAGITAGLARDASALLGGDVRLENVNAPIDAATLAEVVPDDARLSAVVRTNAMAFAGERRVVTALKAVDDAYPLFGEVVLDPPQPLSEALAGGGAVVEPALLARLGLEIGDRMRIGDADLTIRARLLREPDRLGGFVGIGPRSLIALQDLERSGIIQPGSLARYSYRLALPDVGQAADLVESIKATYPDVPWRVRGREEVQPRVARFTDRLASYLTIAGLTALLIGGVGIGLAVQNYLASRTTTIATLKCLGARSRLIAAVYLIQVLVLASLGVLLGLVLGQLAPLLLRLVPASVLPTPVVHDLYPAPLLLAAGCGYLVALSFALWPIARARDVSAASVFRSLVAPRLLAAGRRDLIWIVLALTAFAGLALLSVGDRVLGLIFIAVTVIAAVLLSGLARALLIGVARAGRRAQGPLRLALANLQRPGADTTGVVVALGAGLAVLTMVALLRENLVAELERGLPERAPAFFFIDIQPDQLQPFQAALDEVEGVELLDQAPIVRGRVVQIAGRPVDQVEVDPEVRWTVRRDRGLTFSAAPPAGTQLAEGAWWPADYDGPPLVSVDAEVARGYGVGLGDTLAFNVLGRTIEAEIASTREVAWENGGMNWVFMLSPGVLEAAPYSVVATVDSPPAADAALIDAVTDRLPNVTPISVRQILAQLGEALGKIGLAVTAVGGVTLASGVLVLAGAIAAARRRHLYESVVLKVLGARRADLLRVFLLEYLALGLAAAAAGGLIGTLAAWSVVRFVFDLPWHFAGLAVTQVLGAGVALTLIAGFAGTWRLLGRPAAPVLRMA